MADEEPMSEQILVEAQGAHERSREILALMREGEDAEDQIRMILGRLDMLRAGQERVLARLRVIERHLGLRER